MKRIFIRSVTFVRSLKGKRQQAGQRLKSDLFKVKSALAQETEETKVMLDVYRRFTMKQASKEEMRFANKQFGDLLKSLGLGVIVILPFSPITIPLIVKLGQKVGIDVLPSSFADWSNKPDHNGATPIDKDQALGK
ncbi:hypothetical protein HR060_07685 [Catenovulum sp. SM1970]|uniref:hypothetical protein n=1 Tax=Marinifaba aquimaris TaxID=2741323 RepID=UPI0015731866|nr:hypothetical protein [Marinifaba aquimaris]NTS76749.1 hypothetical protein [Marinifaba aquimaris]